MEFKAMKWRSSMSLILLLAAMLFSSGIPKQEVMVRKTTPKSLIAVSYTHLTLPTKA